MLRSMIVLLLGLAMAGCASERQQEGITVPPGLLGHPIGTYLRIEGVRAEKGKVGEQTLLVDSVGKGPLSWPIEIWVDNIRLPSGVRCVLSGYETGQWIGLPPDVERAEDLPPHQAAWQFQRTFIATSVQAPPSLAEQFRGAGGGR